MQASAVGSRRDVVSDWPSEPPGSIEKTLATRSTSELLGTGCCAVPGRPVRFDADYAMRIPVAHPRLWGGGIRS